MLRFAPIMRTALLIAVASLLCTCARQPSLLEEVRTLGELRVVTRNSPITYYIGQAGPEGPDYELARGFAEQLGVKLKLIEAARFSDLLTEIRAWPCAHRCGRPDGHARTGQVWWISGRPTSRSASIWFIAAAPSGRAVGRPGRQTHRGRRQFELR